jgi:hypothetical protein
MSYSFLMWFCRSSLVQEALMVWSLHGMIKQAGKLDYFPVSALALWTWIVALKFIKVSEHFWAYPGDAVYFPGYLLCGHFHALLKAYVFAHCGRRLGPRQRTLMGRQKSVSQVRLRTSSYIGRQTAMMRSMVRHT